jgi:CheY-like chemotaxis protein
MISTSTKRILVIDDDEGLRDVIQFYLEAITSWEILTAASGNEGLTIATAEQPDAILLDVMMPEMDGVETFRRIKANSAIQHIPTILLTAKAQTRERQQFANLGIAGLIFKPFKAPELVTQVRSILNWPE